MESLLKSALRKILARSRYRISRVNRGGYPLDFRPHEVLIATQVRPFTMTSPERIQALVSSVRYVVANRIPGALVECGVWRGGSAMAAALTLLAVGDLTRDLFLFDVFDSLLPVPTDRDRTVTGDVALERGGQPQRYWSHVTVEEVQSNIVSTGYPPERVHLVRGKVEETIPEQAPKTIALLRLDTDWYESTRHELHHLYPALSPQGVLIVDDYGSYLGVRQAVDEFLTGQSFTPLLQRIDETGVIALKPSP